MVINNNSAIVYWESDFMTFDQNFICMKMSVKRYYYNFVPCLLLGHLNHEKHCSYEALLLYIAQHFPSCWNCKL